MLKFWILGGVILGLSVSIFAQTSTEHKLSILFPDANGNNAAELTILKDIETTKGGQRYFQDGKAPEVERIYHEIGFIKGDQPYCMIDIGPSKGHFLEKGMVAVVEKKKGSIPNTDNDISFMSKLKGVRWENGKDREMYVGCHSPKDIPIDEAVLQKIFGDYIKIKVLRSKSGILQTGGGSQEATPPAGSMNADH